MKADINPEICFDQVARICGIISACIGGVGLAGWGLGSRVLTSVRMEYIPMAPNTALIIILLGLSLYSVATWPGHRTVRMAIAGLVSVCLLIAGLTLVSILTGVDLRIDYLFISTRGTLGLVPVGRMSPVTAICFILGCTALLLLLQKKNDPAALLGTAITLIAGTIIIGYWYGAPLLYGGTVILVALTTAFALGVQGIGLSAAAGPASWPLSSVTGASTTRARLLRGLLPIILMVVVTMNWINVIIMGTAGSTVVLVSAVTVIICLLVVYLVVFFQSREIGDAIDQSERERKRAEVALRESEERFRLLFEQSPVPYQSLDADGCFLTVNNAWLATLGYDRDEVIGHWFGDFIAPEFSEMFRVNFSKFKAAGEIHVEFNMKRKDGSVITVIFDGKIGHYPNGTFRQTHCIFRDITREKRVEEALNVASAYNRSLIEASLDPLVTISIEGKIQDVNTATEKVTGLHRDELIGTDFSEYFTEPQKARDGYLRVLSDGKVIDYPLEIRHHDGHITPVLYNATVYHNSDGNVKGIFAAARDSTGLKRAEEALHESEAIHHSVVTAMAEGVVFQATGGKIIAVNPAAERIGGRTAEQMIGHTSEDPQWGAIYEDGSPFPGEKHPSMVTLHTGQSQSNVVMGIYRPDGILRWISINSEPLVAPGGSKPYAAVMTFHDITERKQAEEALRKSEEKFRGVFNWANDAIMLHTLTTADSPGRFIDVNRVACHLLGYSRDELLTRGPLDIVPAEYHSQFGEIIRQAATKESVLFETRFLRKDGITIPVESSGHIVTFEGRRIWLSHIRDITERKRAEETRERFIRELAQKNTELDRFTYTVSHDLKSPLIGIRAFLSLLEDDLKSGDTKQVQKDIFQISESAEKLERLIATLLELSRSGRTVDEPVCIPFSDLAREAAGLLAVPLNEHHIMLVIPDNLPEVSGDRQRLLQVMTNLLDNAVKFMGDQKEPRVEVGLRTDAGTPVFFVRDNGMGMRKENQSKAFGLFERFNPDVHGSGIGLSTVKRIIEAHGGKIWVESDGEGKGTTVCFTLPGPADDGDENRTEQE
jgi:PAS domain S-box-containing protein